jgi:hypothetical protein
MPTKKKPEKKSAVKKSKMPQKPPFEGAVGAWVKRREYEGVKSFGLFTCHRCSKHKTWQSAHAFKNYRQGCKKCNKKWLPIFLWKNDDTMRKNGENMQEKRPPHDSRRCEACKLGLCSI